MKLAPCYIQFVIACHISGDPEKHVGVDYWGSPTGKTVRQWMLDNGLVDSNWETTERGRAFVEFICETPLPVCKWVRP